MIIIYRGMVHGDYTLSSAPQRIKDFGNPPKANDTLKKLSHNRQSQDYFDLNINCFEKLKSL